MAVPNILRTFAIGYKIVVIYSAMATVSPRLHAVGFFMPIKYHFPGSGKRSFQYGGCMIRKILALRWESYHLITNGECDRHHCIYTSRSVYNGYKMAIMQNSILLSDAQVRPAGISVEEGINTLKCEIKKLAKTKSETFSYICEETVTYGEVVLTMVGFAAVMAIVMIGGFIFGGEVA